MKSLLSLAVACLLATASLAQTSDPAQKGTDAANAFFKAMLDENSAAIEKLVAPDFELINHDGQSVDGGLLVQAVSGGYVVVDTGVLSNVRTKTVNGVNITTGLWKNKITVQSQASPEQTVAFTMASVPSADGAKVSYVVFSKPE